MSIFGKIAAAIFGTPAHAAEAGGDMTPTPNVVPTGATPTATAPAQPTVVAAAAAVATPVAAAPAAGTASKPTVDVAVVLDGITAKQKEALDWRKSIVDLMKLLHLDSSLTARKDLAKELHYAGDMGDSASMNVWLHKQVMTKLAENGGVVPADLKH